MFTFRSDKKKEKTDEKIGELISEPVPVKSEQVSQKVSEPVSQKASDQSKPEQLKTVTPLVNTETSTVPAQASQNNTSAPSVSSAQSAVPTVAPKVSLQRVNNNETITTVEQKGGDASQVGNDGKTKITKRKRKDGTEETVYTTTEVVRKKKEK